MADDKYRGGTTYDGSRYDKGASKAHIAANKGKTPNHHKELHGIQHDPSQIKHIDFKQDYMVMIRKKKYYAISQENDELYIRVYQLNNFTQLRTSHNVDGRPGRCTISLKGAERVICADKEKVAERSWKSFEDLKKGWASIEDEKYNEWDGVSYDNLMKTREQKYYWKFAEKASWEPMDEVYVFAKSKVAKQGNTYKFVQIFFGYITSISKTYQANGGLTVNIDADDHLKLLEISRMAMRPPLDMRVAGVGVRYDGLGNMIVEDRPQELVNTFQHFFAGAYPYEIITQSSLGAGIPEKYLTKRIEHIKRIPFLPEVQQGKFTELFSGNFQTRLGFCKRAAEILNLEFFADEEGNIVLKIPSYGVGINKMDMNFGDDKYKTGGTFVPPEPVMVTEKVPIYENRKTGTPDQTYTVKKGDTLWGISKTYLKKGSKWREIWNLNKPMRSNDPNLIYPGEKIIIKKGTQKTEKVIIDYKEVTKEKKLPPTEQDNKEGTTSANDDLIRVIKPEEIIAFTLVDSDRDVYTASQVQAQYPLNHNSIKPPPPAITRAVSDFDLIRQFGYRPAPLIDTPIVSSAKGAAIYAALTILRSVCNRYTGSLTMIEESTIRVGDPIRFHSYDEHPKSGNDKYPAGKYPGESVYYVVAVDRNISVHGVSTMTLTLRAGRMMGEPSIYDQATELYRYFREDVAEDPSKDAGESENAAEAEKEAKNAGGSSYTIKKGDSLWKIALEQMGDGKLWKKIWDANRKDLGKGPLVSANRVYPGQVIKIPSS